MADGMAHDPYRQVIEELAKAARIQDPRLQHLAKGTFDQGNSPTSGLTFFDLEAGAKLLYPVLTPLRNSTPRVSGKGGIEATWRAVTKINTNNLSIGVSQGHRGGVIAVQTRDYSASYRGIGLESSVNFEAQYAGMGLTDVRALGARAGLESLMLGEEALILAGNGGLPLGTTPTPTLVGATSGGGLAAATYSVICVALTHAGFIGSSLASGVPAQVTRANADGSTETFGGGSARQSVAGSVTVGGSGAGKITASIAGVMGATGYAWYWGAAGAERLGAITTVPSLVITSAAPTDGQLATALGAGDNSVNQTVFSGLIPIAAQADSGAYKKDLGGAGFAGDGAGGIVEIDDMLRSMWDNYRLSPDEILVSAQESQNITKKVLGAGQTTGAYRINVSPSQGAVAGGVAVTSYLNKFSMAGTKEIPFVLHPNMPPGTVLAISKRLPYPLADVQNVFQIRTRQDYYQIEWPLITRQYQHGVYADEVLQHYFPPSMGLIQGIGNA